MALERLHVSTLPSSVTVSAASATVITAGYLLHSAALRVTAKINCVVKAVVENLLCVQGCWLFDALLLVLLWIFFFEGGGGCISILKGQQLLLFLRVNGKVLYLLLFKWLYVEWNSESSLGCGQ